MGGVYNQAQLLAALRAQGSDPSWLEQRMQQQSAPPPEAQPVPPIVDQALQTLGSSYRTQPQPAPTPAPESMREREAAIPANPYPESIAERDFDPRASTRQLQSERGAAQNEALDLKQRQGEIAAQGLDQQAASAGELEQGRRDGIAATRQRVEQNRADRAALESQMGARLAHIQQLVDQGPPQPSTMSKVMSILGGVLSAAGGAGNGRAAAVGQGLAMLGQSMQGDVNGWMREIQGNQAVHQQLIQAAQYEQGDSEHEINVEKGLQDLAAGVYSSALERIKAQTNSEETRRAATELQNGLRSQMVDAELQHRAAAQQKRGDDVLWRLAASDPDEMARQIAAGNIGKRGQDIYRQVVKDSQTTRKGEAEIAQTEAQTAKLRRENEQGGEEVTPGYVSTIPLSPADKTAIHTNAQAVAGIISDLGELRSIRERNKGGTWNKTDEADAQRIMGAMSTKMSQMNGAGAPSESERELFRSMLSDPTGFYMFKDPTELYDRMARSVRGNFNSKLDSIGVRPRGAATASEGLDFDADKPAPKQAPPTPLPMRHVERLLSRRGPQ